MKQKRHYFEYEKRAIRYSVRSIILSCIAIAIAVVSIIFSN